MKSNSALTSVFFFTGMVFNTYLVGVLRSGTFVEARIANARVLRIILPFESSPAFTVSTQYVTVHNVLVQNTFLGLQHAYHMSTITQPFTFRVLVTVVLIGIHHVPGVTLAVESSGFSFVWYANH